jgi:CubicO group peptidase (beta-lactamase class C family)
MTNKWMKHNIMLFMAALIASSISVANAQKASLDQPSSRRLEMIVDSTMKQNNIPAISVGIVKNGRLVYAGGFGVADRGKNIPVNEHSLYQIGSDTKKFTAIIVKNLIAQGKLSLEKPVTAYLGNVLIADSLDKLSTITLQMLLTHTSGVPSREPSNRRIDGDPMTIEFTEKDLIADLKNMKLDFQPGAKFNYSNFGYAIIGYICEKVTGQTYADLVKIYVTGKYHMFNTTISPTARQSKRIVWPYRKDNRMIRSRPWTMGKMTPAGGIYSNVIDISRLMIKQMSAYQEFQDSKKTDDPLILTKDIAEGHYGFGLVKTVDSIGTRYGHGGDLDGYASGYVFLPQKAFGLILLTSSGGRWLARLEKQIVTELANMSPTL